MWPFKKKMKIDLNFPPQGAAKEWPEKDKNDFVSKTLLETGRVLMYTFVLFDCKNHITGHIYNEPTGELFELTFKKINNPTPDIE